MANPSQTKLILYLIILMGLVGGFLFNGQSDPSEAVAPQPQDISSADLNAFSSLKVDYTVLQDERFIDLRIFGEFPIPTSAPGKSNPFQ